MTVAMKLRQGRKDDFADHYGNKKIGVMYFQQSINGSICTQPFYLSENTDMKVFKALYAHGQIFVPMRVLDEVEIVEEKQAV